MPATLCSLKTRNGFWRQYLPLDQSDVIFLFLHADKRTPTPWTDMIKHFFVFLQTLYSGKTQRFLGAKVYAIYYFEHQRSSARTKTSDTNRTATCTTKTAASKNWGRTRQWKPCIPDSMERKWQWCHDICCSQNEEITSGLVSCQCFGRNGRTEPYEQSTSKPFHIQR